MAKWKWKETVDLHIPPKSHSQFPVSPHQLILQLQPSKPVAFIIFLL